MKNTYGELNTQHMPDGVPQIHMPAWLAALGWMKTPAQLRKEMRGCCTQTIRINTVLAYNLHYELSGSACQTVACPTKEGYKFKRRLEWSCGFEPTFSFSVLNGLEHTARIRSTPGFVGALSGHVPGKWAVAMNYSPGYWDAGVNVNGEPAAWILRKMLAEGCGYEDTRNRLLEHRSIRQAFVTLVSRKRACWIVLDPQKSWCMVEKQYPEPLVIGNAWSEVEHNAAEWEGVDEKQYRAEPGAWILDKYQHEI